MNTNLLTVSAGRNNASLTVKTSLKDRRHTLEPTNISVLNSSRNLPHKETTTDKKKKALLTNRLN
jgi:hypothetical protein